ncbi:MAG: thiamine-phosphate kinase, partial [Solirubrobacteraceae bacterium]
RVDRRVWRLGIGDDAAVLRARPRDELVFTTDALVEDVHFRWRTSDARSLGEKSLAVNLSDAAAMGAKPLGCLLTLGVPEDVSSERLAGFFDGLLARARASHCPLVGGDTVRAPLWLIGVSVVGAVARGRALTRAAACAGDRIFVTGELGGAAAGLALLEGPGVASPAERRLARRQLRPSPPVAVGPVLANARLARAAIDVSDGLAQDLGHVARESGLAAHVELERVPLARGLEQAAAKLGLDPLALALAGGEDYELLFTAPRKAPSAREYTRRLGCPVTEIGAMARGRGVHFTRGGHVYEPVTAGFAHFKPVPPDSEK